LKGEKMESNEKIKQKILKQVGTVPNIGDSVEIVREIRKKLSKEDFDINELNSL